MRWVEERLGVSPVVAGVHQGLGTRNALLALGEPYLEVLALDPAQAGAQSRFVDLVRGREVPALVTVAVAKSRLKDPIEMSRVRPDGVRLEWAVEFTGTPLFFIDWGTSPRPSGLPDAGRITFLCVTTPDPAQLGDVDGIVVREGEWHVDVEIDHRSLH